jgi:hypothetical protein
MTDPKLPAAKRRLAVLLRDEEYGPKLARLRRADERHVLDLIYENRGREARKAIEELDAGRREKRTIGGKARAYAKLPRQTRSDEWQDVTEEIAGHENVFWALYKSAVLAA